MTVVVSVIEIEQGTSVTVEDGGAKGETEAIEELSKKWNEEVVTLVQSTDGIVVPVPKGYVVSGVEYEEEIEKEDGNKEVVKRDEKTVKTGFVIYEGGDPVELIEGEKYGEYNVDPVSAWQQSCRRNQWVWVPVADVNRIWDKEKKQSKLYAFKSTGITERSNDNYEPGYLTSGSDDNEKVFTQHNMAGMTREKLYEEIKITLEETVKSIEKYGGYYIGRYETGNVTNDKGEYYGRPVVARMNSNINDVSWYEAYSKMKYLGANANVKASMMSGALWGETMQWFVESEAKKYEDIVNSVDWGNYYDSSFEYITQEGEKAIRYMKNYTQIPTGSTERNKANNVYDMAGNVLEWVLECDGKKKIRRVYGGDYASEGSRFAASSYYFNTTLPSYVRVWCTCIFLHKIAFDFWHSIDKYVIMY